jgi:hypothetical protein
VTQRLVVSVDGMSVQDVFAQVLDLFQLVSQSDPSVQSDVVWRLVSVTMSSPLVVTAEAEPARPEVQADESARRQKRAFAKGYGELRSGRVPAAWSGKSQKDVATRLLARNRNGVARTTIDVREEPNAPVAPIIITKDDAERAAVPLAADAPEQRQTKEQIGSVEGQLLLVQRYYEKPAIQIVERKTKQQVWCVVPEEFQHQISEQTSVEDVWKGSRVLVKGKILYLPDGTIARVVATSVRRIEALDIAESEIKDRQFTGGLSVAEYLEKFRDGTLG